MLAGNESCLACAATIAGPVCLGAGLRRVCIYVHVCVSVCLDAAICSAWPAFSRLPHRSQETSIIVLCVCVCVCVYVCVCLPGGIESRVNTHVRLSQVELNE